jgi:exosortase H (IPTLxxWG-CTERM-specific)
VRGTRRCVELDATAGTTGHGLPMRETSPEVKGQSPVVYDATSPSAEKNPAPLPLEPGDRRMLRFFILFLLIQAVLFTAELTPPGQQYVVQPFTGMLASISASLIELTGREIIATGVIIRDATTHFAVEIAAGCNGVEAMILLTAAMLAFPAPWRYKFAGIAIGLIAIQALNLVRIVSLFFLGMWNETAFEWAHLYIWQALIMLDALIVWLLWIRALPRGESRDALAAV